MTVTIEQGIQARTGEPAVRLSGSARPSARPEAVTALREVDLDVRPGEFVCLLGASGCGKSTCSPGRRAGSATAGEVGLNTSRPSFMFQEPALLPWLDAGSNVELPLRLNGVGRSARRQRAKELLELVRLDGQSRKRPHELSGGRCASGWHWPVRSPPHPPDAADPNGTATSGLLLMDEPFAALDAITRDVLQGELLRCGRPPAPLCCS